MPRLPALPLDKVGHAMLTGVDRAVDKRWDHARAVAAGTIGSVEERIVQAKRAYIREMTAIGAAAGGAAAVPGVGTVGAAGTAAAEFGWFATRSADLVLVVAAIHGHTAATIEQRKAWILAVLAFGEAAAGGFTQVAGEAGQGLGHKLVGKIPGSKLAAINRTIGRTVVTKYGTKRGAVALGRVLPFGIGAAIGGSANYAFAKALAAQADRFFQQVPLPLDGRVIDVAVADPAGG
jgi:hypothetical protein